VQGATYIFSPVGTGVGVFWPTETVTSGVPGLYSTAVGLANVAGSGLVEQEAQYSNLPSRSFTQQ